MGWLERWKQQLNPTDQQDALNFLKRLSGYEELRRELPALAIAYLRSQFS